MHIGLSPLQSGSSFEATIQECEHAEALGFNSVWLGEHHNHPWPHPVVKRLPGTLTIQRLAKDRFILGTPAQCMEQIERFQRQLGLIHLICRLSFPGVSRQASMASVELFSREVMPTLRQAHTS